MHGMENIYLYTPIYKYTTPLHPNSHDTRVGQLWLGLWTIWISSVFLHLSICRMTSVAAYAYALAWSPSTVMWTGNKTINWSIWLWGHGHTGHSYCVTLKHNCAVIGTEKRAGLKSNTQRVLNTDNLSKRESGGWEVGKCREKKCVTIV